MNVTPKDIIQTNKGLIGEVISVLENTVVADVSQTPNFEKFNLEHSLHVFHHSEFKVIENAS